MENEAQEPKRMGQIEVELKRVDEMINNTSKQITKLTDKIAPITKGNLKERKEEELSEPKKEFVPLARELHGMGDRIALQIDRLRKLIASVEL